MLHAIPASWSEATHAGHLTTAGGLGHLSDDAQEYESAEKEVASFIHPVKLLFT